MNKSVLGCCVATLVGLLACGGATATDGTNGVDGTNGADGAQGPAGSSGTDGVNGEAGAPGANGATGDQGEVGATGQSGANGSNGADGATGSTGASGANGSDGANGSNGSDGASGSNGTNGADGSNGADGANGVSLCGDVQMPEWHKPCGGDLVGACASSTARWECHLFLGNTNGDVTSQLEKVCADSTTHVVLNVGAANSAEYPNNPPGLNSGRCDQDADCDGLLDMTKGHLSSGEEDSGIDVTLGDVVSLVDYSNVGHACKVGAVVCVDGALAVGNLADAANVASVGLDCFNFTTTLEQSFACADATGAYRNGDGDSDSNDSACEEESQLIAGAVTVSCVAPSDAKYCPGAP